jgi:integrase
MNRPRKHDKDLPQCMYFRRGAYYYVKRGKWMPLGKNRAKAMSRYGLIYEGAKGSVAELIAKAMPVICAKVKPNTAAQYRVAGAKLAKILAEFAPIDVTESTVAQVRKQLKETPNMANRCLTVLRLVFYYALDEQIVTANPVLKAQRYVESKRNRLLSIDELAAIYQASGPRLRIIIDLAIRTGQRIGDVLRIHRGDLTDDGIRFKQQKTGAKVVVPWTAELREVVDRAKGMHQNIKSLTLLHNRRGKVPDYSTVKLQWDKARKAANVEDAHLHDLRAMAATWAKRQGLDAKSLLGHTNAAQTERYLRDRDAVIATGPSFGQSANLLDRKK